MTFTGSLSLTVEPTYVCRLLEQGHCLGIIALFHTNASARVRILDGCRHTVRRGWVSGEDLE